MIPNPLALLQTRTEPLVVPGIADTLGALCAHSAGFEAVFLAGSAAAQFHLGRPDIGLLGSSELLEITRRITERTSIPVIADIDTGFGNAFNVYRTVRSMALAGAACVQLEDQETVKPVTKPLSRPVISISQMVGKIQAALEAREGHDLLISARTDARYTEGRTSSLERAQAYAEAGADLVFVEGLAAPEERAALSAVLPAEVPKVFNAAILDQTPEMVFATLKPDNYQVVIFPTLVPIAASEAMTRCLSDLSAAVGLDHHEPFDFSNQNQLFLDQGTRWSLPGDEPDES